MIYSVDEVNCMTEKILLEVLRGYKSGTLSKAETLARLKNFSSDAVENFLRYF